MYQHRLERLQREMQTREVHCVALIPGANLYYMTGLEFHLMERPLVCFIPAQGMPVFAVPSLELPKFEARPFDLTLFPYSDEQGPAEAFREAISALPETHNIAVEFLAMRVLELRLVQRHLHSAVLEDAHPIMDRLRLYKDAAEVALMREAIAITEQALQTLVETARPGMTERQLASRLTLALIEAGGGAVPFDPIVLGGPRAALPHGGPTDRPVQAGEVLLVDFGTRRGGYVSDITRTFAMGRPLEGKQLAIYEAVQAANAAGRAAARPGVACQDVDRAARQVIVDAGFGEYFIHRTGHGIGLDGHERPYIVEGNETILEEGMTFTVEPGIYIPGEIGVRIEDDVLITPTGCESLTGFARDLLVIGTGG
jgi:Xaa-Pro dipeptidase